MSGINLLYEILAEIELVPYDGGLTDRNVSETLSDIDANLDDDIDGFLSAYQERGRGIGHAD